MKRGYDYLFPTLIMVVDFDKIESDLENCKNLLLSQIDDNLFNKQRTVSTDDGLFKLPPFKKLVSLIDEEVEHYCNELLLVDKKDLKMVSMWANVHKGKSMHPLHMHPNAFVSGVIYLYAPENYLNDKSNAGNISFEDPRSARHSHVPDYKDPLDVRTARQWEYKPKTGKLILFPGFLKHQVNEFDSGNDYRISVSFNYMLVQSTQPTMSFNLI